MSAVLQNNLRAPTSDELRILQAVVQAGDVRHLWLCLPGLDLSYADRARVGVMNLIAAVSNDPHDIDRLRNQNADVNSKSTAGRSPLHCAATAGHVEVVKRLITYGANVNAQDREGVTPLHCSAKTHHVQSALALIEAGAYRTTSDDDGKSFLDHGTPSFARQLAAWDATRSALTSIEQMLTFPGVDEITRRRVDVGVRGSRS